MKNVSLWWSQHIEKPQYKNPRPLFRGGLTQKREKCCRLNNLLNRHICLKLLKIHSHEIKPKTAVEVFTSKMIEPPQKNHSMQWQPVNLWGFCMRPNLNWITVVSQSTMTYLETKTTSPPLCERAHKKTHEIELLQIQNNWRKRHLNKKTKKLSKNNITYLKLGLLWQSKYPA